MNKKKPIISKNKEYLNLTLNSTAMYVEHKGHINTPFKTCWFEKNDSLFPVYRYKWAKAEELKSEFIEVIKREGDFQGQTTNVKALHTQWRMHDGSTFEPEDNSWVIFYKLCEYIKYLCALHTPEVYGCDPIVQNNKYFLKVVDCWGALYEEGDKTILHNHEPTQWSFGYYIDIKPGDSPIVFPDIGEEIYPENGDVMIFPGYANHFVPTQLNNHERIMVAGNIEIYPFMDDDWGF